MFSLHHVCTLAAWVCSYLTDLMCFESLILSRSGVWLPEKGSRLLMDLSLLVTGLVRCLCVLYCKCAATLHPSQLAWLLECDTCIWKLRPVVYQLCLVLFVNFLPSFLILFGFPCLFFNCFNIHFSPSLHMSPWPDVACNLLVNLP